MASIRQSTLAEHFRKTRGAPPAKRAKVLHEVCDEGVIGKEITASAVRKTSDILTVTPQKVVQKGTAAEPQGSVISHRKRKKAPDRYPSSSTRTVVAPILSSPKCGEGSAKRQLHFSKVKSAQKSGHKEAEKPEDNEQVAQLRFPVRKITFDDVPDEKYETEKTREGQPDTEASTSGVSTAVLRPSPAKLPPQALSALQQGFKKSGKLADLKKQLASYSSEVKTILDEHNRRRIVDEREPSGTTTPKKGKGLISPTKIVTPEKSVQPLPSTKPPLPGHIRLKHLAVSPGLTLPSRHRLLCEMFKTADNLIALMHNRRETVTFERLQGGVEHSVRRKFLLKHVKEMKTVYPEAYNYEQRHLVKYGDKKSSGKYALIISPNIETDLVNYIRDTGDLKTPVENGDSHLSVRLASPLKTPVKACAPEIASSPHKVNLTSVKFSPRKDGGKLITPSHLAMRSEVFHWRIVELVKEDHKKWLRTLPNPVELPEDKPLFRWHPKFPLERIAEIPEADLPEAPNVEIMTSAKDALSRVRTSFQLLPPGVEEALLKSGLSAKTGSEKSKQIGKKLLGLDPALLNKIRQREADKQKVTMLMTSGEEVRKRRLGMLPDLVRSINLVFAANDFKPLLMADVLRELKKSHSIDNKELEACIQLALEVLQDWLRKYQKPSTKCVYLKCSTKFSLEQLLKRIEEVEKSGIGL